MLPPFIIEQIRKREQEERRRRIVQQPRVEVPLVRIPAHDEVEDDDPDRGAVILDLG